MTRISAAKIICIHNVTTWSKVTESPHKATHFRGQLFQLPDIFRFFDFLFGGSLTALALFSYNRNAAFFINVSLAKCFCFVIQRQTTFSLHNNNPPSFSEIAIYFVIRESSFNMTRGGGDEDIETRSLKF